MLKKICPQCKKEFFAKTKRSIFCCHNCSSKYWRINHPLYIKNYYQENKKEINEKNKVWKRSNPEKLKKIQKKSNQSEKTKLKKNEWLRNYKKGNKQKVNSRNMATKKVKLNLYCEICGSKENLQRHHWNYEKPLLVNTLCSNCHSIQHIKQLKGGNAV